jgi:hypothetical protein
MRVVLTKELNRELARRESGQYDVRVQGVEDAEVRSRALVLLGRAYLAAGDPYGGGTLTSHTRGFLAPGIGAWFDTEIRTPVVAKPAVAKDPQSDYDDVWEEAKRELAGKESAGETDDGDAEIPNAADAIRGAAEAIRRTRALFPGEAALDEEFIRHAIDAAVDAIRRYGHRIEGLGVDESIVVAIRFDPGGRSLYSSSSSSNSGPRILDQEVFLVDATTVFAERVEVRTAVIRVPRQLIDLHRDGRIDAKTFAERASVTRY